jgi:hypothetical protein
MSKFVDKLQSLSKSSVAPIGFHPAASESKSWAMLLIVGLSGAQVKEAQIAADAKADAGLILGQVPSASVVRQMVEAAGDVPLGVFVRGMNEEEANELVGSGCDFVVFDIKAAAAILHREEVGKFLMVEPSLDQGFVRAINNLEVDGVFISGGDGDSFVAVEHLLVCRRFVELLEKPVVLTLPSSVTRDELTNVWQAGVDGVVALSMQPVEELAEIKKMIGDLPNRARGRRAKAGVMLPRQGGVVATEEEEEEDEESEEV